MNHTKLGISLFILALSMLLLAYASFPLYNLFCKVTGYGGTVKIGATHSAVKGSREIIVKFDANVMPDLPWKFYPKQKEVKVKLGETILAFYYAENLANEDIVGTAVYNVTPSNAGLYFNKIDCFCFEEQTLRAKSGNWMPVSFFIDPEFAKDKTLENINSITLSYSFFRLNKE